MPAEGVVSDGHIDAEGGFFAGDLPFTHPFGKDSTTDIVLDRPFAGLAQKLGSAPNDIPDGSIHSELPLGLFPQDGHGSILPGFLSPDGDRIATSGTWVVDCGHPDYHTEIHDMNFLAFGHSEGDRTVAHAFAVPYDVTNLFTTHASLVTRFSSPTRLGPPVSQPIGPFLFNLLQGIATGKVHSDHLFEHNVVVPTEPMWPSWYVCAPPSARGSLGFSYRFTVRPGIAVTAKPNDDLGCVRFEAVATGSFRPAPITVRSCPLSWSSLERVAAEAGLGQFDVQGAIASQVPATFRDALRPVIRHSPVFDCFRPFSVAPPGGSSARSLLTDDAQPFPFYGEVTVTRK
jgi:hypothetical protein